jgi:transposase-like protein
MERAMTSRTNGDSKSPFQEGQVQLDLATLEQRRQEAVKRYFDEEPIERLCQEMGCSKSWLYKWKNRYQVTEPDWSQAHSRRPQTTPTKTPEAVASEIVRLSQTLSPEQSGTVSARVIRDHLGEHGGASIPSIRTIYRILNRHAKEVNSHSMTA